MKQEKKEYKWNPQQRAALQATEGAVLLLAVPGSGKTSVLIHRIIALISEKGIQAERILVLTYTVAAAEELRQRFKAACKTSQQPAFYTLNGLSYRILQFFAHLCGKKLFDIDEAAASEILKQEFFSLHEREATDYELKCVRTAIAYAKNMQMKKYELDEFTDRIPSFPLLYERYQQQLRRNQLMDYDDLMVYALKILRDYPQVLEYFQMQWQYVCVDEAQDTSLVQHEIIRLLSFAHGNLFLVGDEDQSIYGFRAACPMQLLKFEQTEGRGRVLLMEHNYRCSEEIVAAANRLICHNHMRREKQMQAISGKKGAVRSIPVKARSLQYEPLLSDPELLKTETAVLYRNHESALPLIDQLERTGISYELRPGDGGFFSHPVVRDLCDLLQFVLDPCRKDLFLRIYSCLNAGISKEQAEVLEQGAEPDISLLEQIPDPSFYTQKRCRELKNLFRETREKNAGKAIADLLTQGGYNAYMETRGMDAGKAEILKILGDRTVCIQELFERLHMLQEISRQGKKREVETRLLLSTIHSSKGLEYERVYLLDMIQGILPCADPKEIQIYEEERRLYYVAVTRARHELNIFTFGDHMTSVFTKEALETQYDVSAYSEGSWLEHRLYGPGQIRVLQGDQAEIYFERNRDCRVLSLTFCLKQGLIEAVEVNSEKKGWKRDETTGNRT